MNENWQVTGVDLAWGDKMPDAIMTGHFTRQDSLWFLSDLEINYEKRSALDLCDVILSFEEQGVPHLMAVDAPLVCQNKTGSRPVDRECSARYRQYEAGCHPVNLNLVTRPIVLAEALRKQRVMITKDWLETGTRAIEVYPHPTMIHWFKVQKTIKYKKGRVSEKRLAFTEYQNHLKTWLQKMAPQFKVQSTEILSGLLNAEWTKETEDQLDSFFCLLIACWEVMYKGSRSQALGDDRSGFIIIPQN